MVFWGHFLLKRFSPSAFYDSACFRSDFIGPTHFLSEKGIAGLSVRPEETRLMHVGLTGGLINGRFLSKQSYLFMLMCFLLFASLQDIQ